MKFKFILILILLSGCNANKLLQMAINKGAKVDQTTEVKTDTVFVDISEWEFKAEAEVDTVYLETQCDSLKSENKETRHKAVKDIQEEVCPDVEELVTLKIPVTVDDSTYHIDVVLSLQAKGGKLSAKLYNKPASITYVSTTNNTTEISSPSKFKWWHFILVALAGVGLGVLVKR